VWTPGQLHPLADESAWLLEPDSSLVVQLHLRPTGKPEVVRPSIGFFFTDTAPARVPFSMRLSRQDIDIPAGSTDHVVEDRYVLPTDVELHEVQPHAHYLAREVQGLARLPDGSNRWLIYIKDWDFNWQNVYRLATPLALPQGTELLMRYVFDNSQGNVRNPSQPPRRVTWGQNSTDEMAELWLQVFPRTPQGLALLERDYLPKMTREDLVGFQQMLGRDPGNPRLHEAVAFYHMQLGRHGVALDHLRTSVRLDPDSAYGHYNLGTALIALGEPADSIAPLERAVRLRPDLASAHNNLAGALWTLGKRDEAIAHYRQALLLEPNHGVAHKNLGSALAAVGKIPEALVQFQLALKQLPDEPELLQATAWILAAHPDAGVHDPAEAIQLAERADTLTSRQNPRVLDLLAVAHSAALQFEQAIPIARQALALARGAGADALAAGISSRLRLYQEGKPYRLDFSRNSIDLDVR
jgi:tetratricopeptide (TPR) repeat protein